MTSYFRACLHPLGAIAATDDAVVTSVFQRISDLRRKAGAHRVPQLMQDCMQAPGTAKVLA
jgi:hypothetical protein